MITGYNMKIQEIEEIVVMQVIMLYRGYRDVYMYIGGERAKVGKVVSPLERAARFCYVTSQLPIQGWVCVGLWWFMVVSGVRFAAGMPGMVGYGGVGAKWG